jgi:hypothetical protein
VKVSPAHANRSKPSRVNLENAPLFCGTGDPRSVACLMPARIFPDWRPVGAALDNSQQTGLNRPEYALMDIIRLAVLSAIGIGAVILVRYLADLLAGVWL